MKIDPNDPRITAFALGELSGRDAIELARAVRSDERISQAVEEVRQTAHLLGGALSSSGAEMLTPEQRAAVRSAGASPVIEDIASARVAFWRKPAVVATGVAAAVAATLYMVAGKQPLQDDTVISQNPSWNWSQVDTRDLTAPVRINTEENGIAPDVSDAARAVSTAISDDTDGFRSTVKQRINSIELKAAQQLPELNTKEWQDVSLSERIAIPMSSGAASWPWIKRYLEEASKVPPKKAVRIEEMINHFSYKKPDMIQHGALAADMELCRTPWNSQTHLLAVHLSAQPGSEVESLGASLIISSDRVKKLRLLGYADAVLKSGPNASHTLGAPALASRTRGNFVFYELLLEPDSADAPDGAIVSLNLGGNDILTAKESRAWEHASADMRFASMIAALGMILSDYPSMGELAVNRLGSMVELIEKTDGESLTTERNEGLRIVRKAQKILLKTAD